MVSMLKSEAKNLLPVGVVVQADGDLPFALVVFQPAPIIRRHLKLDAIVAN